MKHKRHLLQHSLKQHNKVSVRVFSYISLDMMKKDFSGGVFIYMPNRKSHTFQNLWSKLKFKTNN